ncbi:MAG: enoyl-CoA hydratase/isomerase family protein, partial [Pseudaminobacter sp.]
GNRNRYGDALWSGLATHTVQAEYLGGLTEQLAETGNPGQVLREVFKPAQRETDQAVLQSIATHFSRHSLQEVLESLERAAPSDEFAAKTLATMRTRSPTSLAVAFRQITTGSTLSMDECMRMEFRIVNRMVAGHDFYEGIRAVLIDKGSTPVWRPATLDDLDPAEIDAYFAPLPGGDLDL